MSTETDIGTIRLIIKSAVSIALFSLLAGIGLALNAGRENAVVVAAAGALLSIPASCLTGGLLAKTSTTHAGSFSTTPVVVTNPSTDPVPVAEAGAETNSTPRTASTL